MSDRDQVEPTKFVRAAHDVSRIRAQRQAVKSISESVRRLYREGFSYGLDGYPLEADATEARTNVELAYRHLEDAAMRLGKALQALDGGVSVYDRSGVTEPLSATA
jgi:hypothetical protein